jgi:hypothetical protein|tara:strand:+ start:119058 stop:119651 length:594 start_codon:yes stop_codon:yes gene_type:complete
MITWISEPFRAAIALLALSALTACEGGQGLTLGGPAAPEKPLLQTKMAGGAVHLVPPQGYCIDRKSLKPRFALMARCDALGVPDVITDAPLGILTVSLVDGKPGAPLPTPTQVAKAAKLTRVMDPSTRDGATIFAADGPVPIEGMSARQWRGTALIGGQTASVTFYGPPQSRAISGEGRTVVANLIQRSVANSPATN